MFAANLTFGVEIETSAPATLVSTHGLVVGSYHQGVQVPYLPQGWKAERDSSIDCLPGHVACEIVSPVLRGPEGIAQVMTVCRILTELGHRVNASCGVHIHVGFQGQSAVTLARLIEIVAYAEDGIFASTGSKTREQGRPGHLCYCKKVRPYGNGRAAKANLEQDRYHILNLKNLANRKGTVEFRCFSGSTNAVKLCSWIHLCLGLVERAIVGRTSPKWSPAPVTGGLKKDGHGASELERLMAFLGWSPSYAKARGGVPFGCVGQDAGNGLISYAGMKACLRGLAAKYDRGA